MPIRTKGFYKQVKVAESFLIILLALLYKSRKLLSDIVIPLEGDKYTVVYSFKIFSRSGI